MSVIGLAVMARAPVRGQVKTRLARVIGEEAALRVYERLLDHVRQITQRLPADWRCDWFIADHDAHPDAFADIPNRRRQQGGNLGERMQHAFDELFRAGCAPVVMIGTDCPEMRAATLVAMVDRLRNHDVAIVPAHDGGYVAIGLKTPSPQLFDGPDWGTPDVLRQTLHLAERQGLSVAIFPAQTDLDEATDLPAFPWLTAAINAN